MRILLLLVPLFALAESRTVKKDRQLPGISFAVPGLQLLQGSTNNNNNNNNGQGNIGFPNLNNLFGASTVTKTIISTVSTLITPAFRTCTVSPAALMPCVNSMNGRKRRSIGGIEGNEIDDCSENCHEIDPTPSMFVIIDKTTIKDQVKVSEMLHLVPPVGEATTIVPDSQDEVEYTTVLFPSVETREGFQADVESFADQPEERREGTTIPTPRQDELEDTEEEEDEATTLEPDRTDDEKARVGFKAVTTTRVISVTYVGSTIAQGMMATLTVMYAGCLPPSLPITTSSCG